MAVEPQTHKDMAGGIEPVQESKPEVEAGTVDGNEPTEHELQTLRKVADSLPWSAYLVAVVELCERFTYYGLSGPFQNYIENSYHDSNGLPGAIGLGQTGATGLTDFFQFFCYSMSPSMILFPFLFYVC